MLVNQLYLFCKEREACVILSVCMTTRNNFGINRKIFVKLLVNLI
jgi:hypothetical protein